MRKFWHPGFSRRRFAARLGQADQNHGRTIHALSRRRRQAARRRFSLRAPPNPTFGRLGRGRLLFAAAFTAGNTISSGQCVEQPAEKESFADKIRIRSCPTEEYLKLIFVYFGEGDPPPLPRYPDFEKDTLWAETYIRPCNYVNNLENDPIHIPFTHRESEFYMNRPPEIPDITVEESDWGVLLTSRFPSGRLYITQHGLPNILCFRERDRDHLAWRVPVDDDNHASFQLDVTHIWRAKKARPIRTVTKRVTASSAARRGKSVKPCCAAICAFRTSMAPERSNIVWIQDYATAGRPGSAGAQKKRMAWAFRSSSNPYP